MAAPGRRRPSTDTWKSETRSVVTGAPFLSVTIASTTRTGGRSRAIGGPEGSSGAATGGRLALEDAQPASATRRMTGQAARRRSRQRRSMMQVF